MEIGKGGDLYRALAVGRRYKEGDAARVVRALLSVLTFMHSKRVMHRDLKPENIVLLTESSRTKVKVIDFGSATPFTAGEAGSTLLPIVGITTVSLTWMWSVPIRGVS